MRKTTRFTLTALFAALVFLLGLTPLGLIPLGFIYVTILAMPVIIGTLVLGLRTGLLLGLAFGGVSTFKLLTAPSTLAGNLLGASPALAIAMCILPRLLIPVASHLAHRRLRARSGRLAAAAAGALGSLTNTVFYLGLMLLFYQIAGLDSGAVIALIIGTGLIAGSLEALAAALLTPPIELALDRMIHKA